MRINGFGPWLVAGAVAGGTFLFLKGGLRMAGFIVAGILAVLAFTHR